MQIPAGRAAEVVHLAVELKTRESGDLDAIEGITAIVSAFADACGFGMLGGADRHPEAAMQPSVRERTGPAMRRYAIDAPNVAPESVRVLLGMLEGDYALAQATASLTASVSQPGKPQIVGMNATSGRVPPPGLYRAIAFEVVRHELGRSDRQRLIRARFRGPVPEAYETHLVAVQKTWLRVCAGGLAEGGRPAHESFVSAATGYLVSPRVFEIPIEVFEVAEHAFDPLLNAFQRCSVLDQVVERVDIW
jgi:hypothetical protein